MQKHLVKAGITGWAQVNDLRGDTDLARRIQYDLYYIDHWSVWFDLRILALTLWHILTEPQRPLTGDLPPAAPTTTAASGVDAAGAVPPRPTPREALLAGAALIVAFAIALAAYAVLVVPGPWFPNARTQSWKATDLKLVTGTGVLEGNALVVTASDATNMVVVSLVTDLRSSEFPAIAWTVQRVPDGADVRMLWTTDIAPGRTNLAPVTVESGRLLPVLLTGNPAWVGRVKGIGLAVRTPLSEPFRIEAVSAKPMGVPQVVAERVREWLAFEPFDGASINTITGGADLQDLPLPPLAALAVALATLLLWVVHRKLPRVYAHGPAYTLAALFALAWFALDARWIANLVRQTGVTLARYEGMATATSTRPPTTGSCTCSSKRYAPQCPRRRHAFSSPRARLTCADARPTICIRTTSGSNHRGMSSRDRNGCAPAIGCSSTSAAASSTTPPENPCAGTTARRSAPI